MSQVVSFLPAEARLARFRRYFLYEWLSNPDAHRNYLRQAYAEALSRAQKVRPEIFPGGVPHILLCGVGTANTAETFCRFALKMMPTPQVTLFDLRPDILEKSLRRLRAVGIGTGQIRIEAGDALRMPFGDGTFDWVETDNFLQFFTKAEMPQLINGWHRILKPGGLLTTRQITPGAGWGGGLSRLVWKSYSSLISAPCYEHTADEVAEVLRNECFQIADVWPTPKSLNQITALAAFSGGA